MLKDTINVVCMFYLTSTKKENLVARMQRRALKDNRLDDANLDTIRERLKVYEKETKPVLNFYGKNLVHKINTDGKPAETFLQILKQVVKL
jgi:adenylate kinase